MTLTVADLTVDLSKHRISPAVLDNLIALANEVGLAGHFAAMIAGERINSTEDRAVLHTALRAPVGVEVLEDGENVIPAVHKVLGRLGAFADRVRSGDWVGATGRQSPDGVGGGAASGDCRWPAQPSSGTRPSRSATNSRPLPSASQSR